MGLEAQLAQHKAAIIDKWFKRVVDTYPHDTARFLKSQKDPFANPVGRTTLKALTTTVEALIEQPQLPALDAVLDPVIRIRAVQAFSPSQATAFILDLKRIIRDLIKIDDRSTSVADLLRFETKIDQLCLQAFDIYMKCREQIFEIRINEYQKRTVKAFKRAGLISDLPDKPPEVDHSNTH